MDEEEQQTSGDWRSPGGDGAAAAAALDGVEAPLRGGGAQDDHHPVPFRGYAGPNVAAVIEVPIVLRLGEVGEDDAGDEPGNTGGEDGGVLGDRGVEFAAGQQRRVVRDRVLGAGDGVGAGRIGAEPALELVGDLIGQAVGVFILRQRRQVQGRPVAVDVSQELLIDIC